MNIQSLPKGLKRVLAGFSALLAVSVIYIVAVSAGAFGDAGDSDELRSVYADKGDN